MMQTTALQSNISTGGAARGRGWRVLEWLIYLLVALLIGVRFFTEQVPVLPRFLNAVDLIVVPLLLPLCALWVMVRGRWRLRGASFFVLAWLLLLAWALSWAANASEVHWLGALLFIVGLLTPVAFYLILVNIGLDQRFSRRMLRLLMVLLLANLLIGTVQAAQGVSGTSHDFVFGTFGYNQNQLAFFLIMMVSYLLARWRYGQASRVDLALMLWAGVLFLLCAFQTLWLVFAFSAMLVFGLVTELRGRLLAGRLPHRLVLLVIGGILAPLIVLSTISFARFDVLRTLGEIPTYFDRLGKVQLLRSVPQVWELRPGSLLVGVGPGAFNSRAFRSIAIVPYGSAGPSDVASALVTPFYRSELSARFILPYFQRGIFFLSGANTDGPFTSYVSVPIEIGLPGAAALLGLYALIVRDLVRSIRTDVDVERRILATWALMGVFMLLGLALIDNYLETTRYTMMVWLAAAVWRIQGVPAPARKIA
jgi:hypothetical protein